MNASVTLFAIGFGIILARVGGQAGYPTKPPSHRSQRFSLDGDDRLDDLARGDVVPGMVDFGEASYTEFVGDRLSGTRVCDASAHGFARLPLLEHLALDRDGHQVEVVQDATD